MPPPGINARQHAVIHRRGLPQFSSRGARGDFVRHHASQFGFVVGKVAARQRRRVDFVAVDGTIVREPSRRVEAMFDRSGSRIR